MACNPLPYDGEIDPIACQRWISSTEAVFVRSRCEVEDQVMFATGLLQLQAKDWWDAHSKELGDDKVQTLTWQEFKEPFLKYHIPQSALDKIQEDFLCLRQKDETIDEITNKFLEKVKFCGEIAGTERLKGRKRVAEKSTNTNPSKKGRFQDQNRKGQTSSAIPTCKTCGKHHSGECLSGKKGCYKCGQEGHPYYRCPENPKACYNCKQTGHIKAECPKLQQEAKKDGKKDESSKACGRMFQLTSDEAKASPDVVSVPLEVEAADSKRYLLHDVCRNCKILIEDEEFSIDLVPMCMEEFKVVVGMDWLAQNHAEIQCEKKVIQVVTSEGKRVSIQGDRVDESKFCSIIEAVQYVKNGGKAYLSYVIDTYQVVPKLEDVKVVNEYPDVFPEDLPGLPPEREVEFKIELTPGATPVAKAPYRLAPTEMKELMTQLQELLDKDFIRPSVSPWGAPVLFVRKKDGSMRMCIDYRELNNSEESLPLTQN
ncbi:uncharacterized protein LOC110881701 [Helianthus annuus]|uniref:uncharacterized protein LOC110881701 n=1 Tax=Helianthus annuus TaxID=4232 RepID=UPI000B9086CC|nr:uncharacterized protein LOC110881701 [Helianthus annuus]